MPYPPNQPTQDDIDNLMYHRKLTRLEAEQVWQRTHRAVDQMTIVEAMAAVVKHRSPDDAMIQTEMRYGEPPAPDPATGLPNKGGDGEGPPYRGIGNGVYRGGDFWNVPSNERPKKAY